MNRRVTIEAWEALPADLQRYYTRVGNEYVIEDDDQWAYLLLFYLVFTNGVYRDINGKVITAIEMRRRALKVSQSLSVELRRSYRRALDTKDARVILQWFEDNRSRVASAQIALFDLAIPDSDLTSGSRDRTVARQMAYWDNMANEAKEGKIPTEGRVGMYGRSAYLAFTIGVAIAAIMMGRTQERRVLGAAEHCRDCVSYADQGWQEVGTLPEIGDSICKSNCRCFYEYR